MAYGDDLQNGDVTKCRTCDREIVVYEWRRRGYDWRCAKCKTHPEHKRVLNRRYKSSDEFKSSRRQRRWEDQEFRKKDKCRKLTQYAIATGKLQKYACADCGCEEVEAHHEQYDDPLIVVWLCRFCHLKRHRLIAGKYAYDARKG